MTKITCNYPVVQCKKYIDNPYGGSLVALTMIDTITPGILMDIEFDDSSSIDSFIEYILGIWNNYKCIKTFIRSYMIDSVYKTEFLDKQLVSKNIQPSTITEYNNDAGEISIIIDIEKKESNYKFTFYKWQEVSPRILNLTINKDYKLYEQ